MAIRIGSIDPDKLVPEILHACGVPDLTVADFIVRESGATPMYRFVDPDLITRLYEALPVVLGITPENTGGEQSRSNENHPRYNDLILAVNYAKKEEAYVELIAVVTEFGPNWVNAFRRSDEPIPWKQMLLLRHSQHSRALVATVVAILRTLKVDMTGTSA